MNFFEAGTKVKIINAPSLFRDQIGQVVSVGSNGKNVFGTRGETQLVTFTAGGGIFLKPSDLEAA